MIIEGFVICLLDNFRYVHLCKLQGSLSCKPVDM